MSAAPTGLRATGKRVEVSLASEAHLAPYALAVKLSAQRLAHWNVVDPTDLGRHLQAQSDVHRTFIVRALDDEGSHGIVGKINVSNVVRGRFLSPSSDTTPMTHTSAAGFSAKACASWSTWRCGRPA